ncbi:hypothetical protein DdX_15389 [Ditylenchus destructor]|uniref:Uncharacterized protein n=1 Tax=Ditylenchus destructor TaxID=166010 RepID=A0AAD4QUT4_9BILA|nr:hypothetical protein DdX_15389 [Ditylenchus destructor]
MDIASDHREIMQSHSNCRYICLLIGLISSLLFCQGAPLPKQLEFLNDWFDGAEVVRFEYQPFQELPEDLFQDDSLKSRPKITWNQIRMAFGAATRVDGSGFPNLPAANLVYGLDLIDTADPYTMSFDDEDGEQSERSPIAMPYQAYGSSDFHYWDMGRIPSRG